MTQHSLHFIALQFQWLIYGLN